MHIFNHKKYYSQSQNQSQNLFKETAMENQMVLRRHNFGKEKNTHTYIESYGWEYFPIST